MLARSTLAATALAFGVLLSGLLWTDPAQATPPTNTTVTLAFAMTKPQDRKDPDNPDKGPDKMNLADCTSDDTFTFNFQTTGLNGANAYLYAWLTESSQCQLPTNQGAGENLCHEVASAVNAGGNGVSIVVHVRDIVNQVFGSFSPAGAEVCTGADHPQTRKLQFFLKDQGTNAILGTVVEFPITYDLQGPPPPTSLKTGPGQNVLVVSWHSPDYTAQEIQEYRAYRAALVTAPNGGAAGAAGAAGSGGDTGTGGAAGMGGAPLGPCEFAGLTPGMAPGAGVTKCGETNGRTGEVECTGLQNGVRYAVGVATVDTYYNVGVLSETTCGSPEPVTGFFEAYRDAGGQGGGGYCTIGASRSRTAAVGGVLAALGLIVRRARRRALANGVAA